MAPQMPEGAAMTPEQQLEAALSRSLDRMVQADRIIELARELVSHPIVDDEHWRRYGALRDAVQHYDGTDLAATRRARLAAFVSDFGRLPVDVEAPCGCRDEDGCDRCAGGAR